MPAKHVILVAEDDVDTAAMLEELLRMEGYFVETTTTARAAVDAVATRVYDAVLLDLTMPGMTTEHFVSELLRVGGRSPLMIFSARLPHEIQAVAARLNAAAFIAKPVDIDVLLSTLSQVIGSRSGAEG